MADKLSYGDLVAKVAMNSRLTAQEVEEALEVLTSVIQESLQRGIDVDLLGVGTFSVDNKVVKFEPGQSLGDIVSDPSVPVQIDRSVRLNVSKVFNPRDVLYKHKINVC